MAARSCAPRYGPGAPAASRGCSSGGAAASGRGPGGAITNEVGLRGADIGAIQVAEAFSLVEVPDGAADQVIRALRAATVKGLKVTVRRERY
jgi:ATP-dependent RNA helicase DeaD